MEDNFINICSQGTESEKSLVAESEVEGVVVPYSHLVKVGHVHKILVILEQKDMFKLYTEQTKMLELEDASKKQKKYLEEVLKKGDIHYFKKQTFHASHKRENNKGILTPQGSFDLDPAKFCEENLNADEFEYLGLEVASTKKNDRPSNHHKVLVKFPILKTLVDTSIAIDRCYIPIKGKVLSYQGFYAALCKSKITEKVSAQLDREKNSIARENTIPQINAMEETAFADAEVKVEKERKGLNSKREALEKVSSDCSSMEERAQYDLSKDLLEHNRREIDNEYLERKKEIGKYYQDIVAIREKFNLERAAQLARHNKRRREKRVVDKVKRMKTDNNLSKAWGAKSLSVQDEGEEENDEEEEIEEDEEEEEKQAEGQL